MTILLPLPNLDDRRWSDLVQEGRGLIPVYAPEWTDHNAHDPGITLIELLAWVAEMDVYRLNRIPDRHKLKFLALVGIRRRESQLVVARQGSARSCRIRIGRAGARRLYECLRAGRCELSRRRGRIN